MPEKSSPEPIQMSFKDLIEPTWFKHPEKSTFWVRFYELIMPADAEHMGGAITNFAFGLPIKLTYGQVHDVKVEKFEIKEIRRRQGSLPEIISELKQVQLPESDYVIMTCPLRIDVEGQSDPTRVRYMLDCFAALFRLHFGMNALWQLAYEGERYAHNGVWATAYSSKTVRFPQQIEGPDFLPENWSGITEVTGAIAAKSRSEQRRPLLALRYLNRGCEDSEFINYWTAFEVLAGKSLKIRALLAKAYSFERQHDVDEKLHLRTITQWRHDLVHHGIQVSLSPNIERYLQCLFLDLIRHVMGLKHRSLAAKMLNRPDVDLSSVFARSQSLVLRGKGSTEP